MATLKEDLIDALVYRLGMMSAATGYGTEMGEVHTSGKHPDQIVDFPALNLEIEEHFQTSDPGGQTTGQLEKDATVTIEAFFLDVNGVSDARDQFLADLEVFTAMHHDIPGEGGASTAQYCFLESSEDFGFAGTRPYGGITIKLGVQYAQLLGDSESAPEL